MNKIFEPQATFTQFLWQENLSLVKSPEEDGVFRLYSEEDTLIGEVKTARDVGELTERWLFDCFVDDLYDEAIVYEIELPETTVGIDENNKRAEYTQKELRYWVELRNQLSESYDVDEDIRDYLDNHEFEFDVVELFADYIDDVVLEAI